MALPAFGSASDTRHRHTADMLTLLTARETEMSTETRGDDRERTGELKRAGESSIEGRRASMAVDERKRG